HYKEELAPVRDRVAIVSRGKVSALVSPSKLIATLGGEHVVEFAVAGGPASDPVEFDFASLPAVREVRKEATGIALTVTEPHVAIPALLHKLQGAGRSLARLTTRHASLEDVFVRMTGRHLRDEEIPSA